MKYIGFFLLLPFLTHSQNKPASSVGRGASPIEIKTDQSTSGTTYAVVVGISDYQDKDIPDLRFADKDAFAINLRSNRGSKLDIAQFQLGLVCNLSKQFPGSAVENKKVIQSNTINKIACNNLFRSLRFGNKGNEALNVLHNG